MSKLWLVTGDHEAEGWRELRKAYEAEQVDIVHLDPKVWAMVESEEPPTGYTGLTAAPPADGVYVDPNGSPMYLVGGAVVRDARTVIAALGDEAEAMLARVGDPNMVLERLGRAF